MTFLLFSICAVCAALSSAFLKLYRRRIDDPEVKDNLYYIFMIGVALTFFGITSKFDLRVNWLTLLFAAIYAVIVYVSATFNMNAIEHADLVTVSIFSNSGTILWSALWGAAFFNEPLTAYRIIGLVAIFVAILLPSLTTKTKRSKSSLKGLFFCFGVFFIIYLNLYYIKFIIASSFR